MQKRFNLVLERMVREGIVSPPFLLAVSGGIDSMCLAHLFAASSYEFEVAHCNFHLRGEESDSDQALVRQWCGQNNVKLHIKDFDTKEFASSRGISVEMAARELRYSWFGQLCREGGFGAVVVAHHADDNVETLLLNLVRGTGLKGLCAMSQVSMIPYSDGVSAKLIRPLLNFTRDQIEGYARSHGVGWHEDSTNADTGYRRNLIRNEVMPLLRQLNPSVVKTISRDIRHFSQCAGLLEESLRHIPIYSIYSGREDFSIETGELLQDPQWEYVLYLLLSEKGFNRAMVEDVINLCRNAVDGKIASGCSFVGAAHRLVTTSHSLLVRPLKSEEAVEVVVVDSEGLYRLGESTFEVKVVPAECLTSLRPEAGTLYFDAKALGFPFVCRRWREGDWIRPLGLGGKKKISDLFTDLKYDAFQKEEALLVARDADCAHVFALLGKRIDEAMRITSSTENVIIVILTLKGKESLSSF